MYDMSMTLCLQKKINKIYLYIFKGGSISSDGYIFWAKMMSTKKKLQIFSLS
jgi:hypothetical protein